MMDQLQTMFDVLLVDIQMPEMDGYELTQKIRERYTIYDLPILALSANVSNRDRALAANVGMNSYVCKPFALDDLVNMILALPSNPFPASNCDKLSSHNSQGEHGEQVFRSFVADIEKLLGELPHHVASDKKGNCSGIPSMPTSRGLSARSSDVYRFLDPADKPRDVETGRAVTNKDVLRILHTIKGLASTFGADELAAITKDAYEKITDDKRCFTHKEWSSIRKQIINEGNHVLTDAHKKISTFSPIIVGSIDKAEVTALFNQLIGYLDSHNMKAQDVYHQLQQQGITDKTLDKAMQDLDFSTAANYCKARTLHDE